MWPMQTRVAEIFHNDGDLLHKSIYKVVLKKTQKILGVKSNIYY